MSDTIHDVIIIGGSYAGLSAAMQLGRARRKVLIIDEGLRRNRFASHSHGFITQDGTDPAIIAAEARAQVMRYSTVEWLAARAEAAARKGEAGPTTLLLNDAFEPNPDQLAGLAARDVIVERVGVKSIKGHADVLLADGRTISFSGLFALAPVEVATPILQQLGLDMERGPLVSTIKTDAMKQTSIPGVFSCGDAARPMASVALAVGDGSLAGVNAHRSLMFGATFQG